MPLLNPKTVSSFFYFEKEDKVGYLWKKRKENKKSYKKRYFILCGNILAYFEKKIDKDPLGIIFLDCYSIEMIDDIKMAIRFRGPGELCRSYIFKSENPQETEDWMRVLSRSSVDYLDLILEDFEDHYKALTSVKQSMNSSISKNSISVFSPKRTNPFNRSSSSVVTMTDQSNNLYNKQLCSSIKVNPRNNYIHWLLSQDWEQLNSYLELKFYITSNQTSLSDFSK